MIPNNLVPVAIRQMAPRGALHEETSEKCGLEMSIKSTFLFNVLNCVRGQTMQTHSSAKSPTQNSGNRCATELTHWKR